MLDTNLRIFQANLNRSIEATETALELAVRENVDIIAVQEPWMIQEGEQGFTRSIAHRAFQMILPRCDKDIRPRTMFYVKRDLQVQLTQLNLKDPDIQALTLQDSKGKRLQVVNVYNERDQEGRWTVERSLYNVGLLASSVVLGDFNTRHPIWDPFGNDNSRRANELADWFDSKDLQIQNIPGEGTFYRSHMDRPSILDLTLTRGQASRSDTNWRTIATGSDHMAICIDLRTDCSEPAQKPKETQAFHTARADWEGFRDKLQELASTLQPTDDLDKLAEDFSDLITLACMSCIPRKRLTPQSKPWWTPALRNLRQEMSKEHRKLQSKRQQQREAGLAQSDSDKRAYRDARNRYFQAVKGAKREHWNAFLEKTDPKSIFKAMAYTKPSSYGPVPKINGEETFEGKCRQFRSTLFPKPPDTATNTSPLSSRWASYSVNQQWQWEPLTEDELGTACSASKVKGKTPGPDGITQEIIAKAYAAIPDTFMKVYSMLLTRGYHPKCWRQAIGVILPKPNKPDYAVPKAYRIICLLNCLGKVSERILANRLSKLAELGPLLSDSQMGGRRKRSAVDTAMLFTDFIERSKAKGHKASAVFLDVKGAFDHILHPRLLRILIQKRLPYAIVTWVRSFLEGRLVRLAFDGQTEELSEVETGVPQGSPISPILFLIYVCELAAKVPGVEQLSYIDDFGLLTASTSLKKNARTLQKAVESLTQQGKQQAIEFDLAKTELIHFSKGKGSSTAITLPSGDVIEPAKTAVRWLGIWFDPGLTFKDHIKIRATKAYSSFKRMERLANSERGLTARSLRQLYRACVVSVADYGAPVWWKSKRSVAPLQAIQSKAARKILGVFRTAPVEPTELEASLLPPAIRIERQVALYGTRLEELPGSNPIAKALQDTPIPPALRPTTLGYEVVVPKAKTRLQAIRLRNERLQTVAPKAEIQLATERAWKISYEKAKTKKGPHHSQSYFEKFPFAARKGIELKCKRNISSAFYALKMGHGYFRSYLHRLQKTDNDKCRCGNKETPEHLLLSCSLYQDERPQALRNARCLRSLLEDSQGVQEVLRYLERTKIGTSAWYRQRADEFQEDENNNDNPSDSEDATED